jgi:hypothetical protein
LPYKTRLKRLIRPAFVLLGVLVSSVAAAEPKAVATFESIGLYWTPPADPGPGGCAMKYRRSGEPQWREGFPLWYDARNKECRGSLVQLAPGTRYEIEVGGEKISASTWRETFPISKTVRVASGGQQVSIKEGGSPDGYVLYDGSGATLDANGESNFNIAISAPYVIVRGFTLKGAKQDAIRLLDGAHDVVIEDNDISGWGRLRYVNSAGWQIGADMDSGVRADCKRFTKALERVVVQRNKIHHPRYGANSWSWGHPAGPQGITLSYCGGNHVIRYNEITSDERHYFNDGIGGEDNFSDTGFPNRDSDIYGNVVTHAWDDAIEAEGGDMNVRIWGNYLDQTGTGVATTVTHRGPVYIFRNVYNRSRMKSERPPDGDDRGPFAKAGSTGEWGNGRRYVFHNTLLQPRGPGQYPLGAGGGISGNSKQPLTNTVSRNNLFNIWKPHWPAINEAGGSGNDFDHDLSNGRMTERHGSSSGSGVDGGVRLPNFNDGFIGSAPDIGAQESGAPPLRFGVSAAAPRESRAATTSR